MDVGAGGVQGGEANGVRKDKTQEIPVVHRPIIFDPAEP